MVVQAFSLSPPRRLAMPLNSSLALNSSTDQRPTGDFPVNPSALDREDLESHYSAMRRSHVFMARSQGQMKRQARKHAQAQQRLRKSLRDFQKQVSELGWQKAEDMQLIMGFQQEIAAFERKNRAFLRILEEIEDTKDKIGFWNLPHFTRILERMRGLL